MKKFKIISALLILSTTLTSFNAYAYTDLPASDIIDYIYEFDVGEFVKGELVSNEEFDPDSERIGFLNALGLWDDVEKSKSAFVTVEEFNVIMSKISSGVNNVSVNADKAGNVTYGMTVEALLKELGYYSKCSLYSDKEKAMLDISKEIGLIDEIKSLSSFVTRAELAKIIEKAITIDLCVMKVENGGYEWIVKEKENILNTIHDIYDVSGFLNAISGLSVYGNSYLKEGYIEIDRVAINANNVDCTKYIGRYVKAYAYLDESTDEYKLMYIAPHGKAKYIEIDFEDIEHIKDGYILYTDNGILRKEKIQNYKTITENGRTLKSISEMSDFEKTEGKIVLSPSTKNGERDVATIHTYNYYVVKYIDSFQKRIGLEFGQEFENQNYIQIDEETPNYITINGEISDYTEIPVGSVIKVFKSNSSEYMEIDAKSNKQSGVISGVYEDTVTISGKTYRLSKNLLDRIRESEGKVSDKNRVEKPKVNTRITFYIYGDIFAGYKMGNDYIYAYLKSAKYKETDTDDVMVLRVYTQNMEWLDLVLDERIILDGVEKIQRTDAEEIIKQNKNKIVSNLIRIKTNSEGQITALDTIIETEEEKDSVEDLVYVPEYENGKTIFKHSWDNWSLKNTRYMFKDGASVFVVPDNEEREEKYKVVGATAFTRDVEYEIILYSADELLQVPVMIYRGDMSSGANEKERWLYVTKINTTINEETDEVEYEVVGMNVGSYGLVGVGYCAEEKFIVTADDYEAAVKAGNEFSVGDLMYIEYTGKKLQKWVLETELEKGKVVAEPGIYDNGWIMGNNYQVAVGTIEKISIDGSRPLVSINCGTITRVFVSHAEAIIDLKTGEFTSVELSDFHEGDFVYAIVNGNYCSVLVKNIN